MPDIIPAHQEKHAVSVVIPTLGGMSLAKTIEQLNRGTLVPLEILICIPEEYVFRVQDLLFKNVTVVKTRCRGQVAQRLIGFERALMPLVMQLDDDILIHEDTTLRLVTELCQLGPSNAVAPVYYEVGTGRCIHELVLGFRGFLRNLFYSVICGSPWGVKRMGVMTEIGIAHGVDNSHCDEKPFATQWLPGGCVLCFKNDLIKEDFFPFSGKAYCEDLIHSYLRTKNGIKHWVIPNAHCFIGRPEPETSKSSVLAASASRKYLVRLTGGTEWRLTLYNALSELKRALLKYTPTES